MGDDWEAYSISYQHNRQVPAEQRFSPAVNSTSGISISISIDLYFQYNILYQQYHQYNIIPYRSYHVALIIGSCIFYFPPHVLAGRATTSYTSLLALGNSSTNAAMLIYNGDTGIFAMRIVTGGVSGQTGGRKQEVAFGSSKLTTEGEESIVSEDTPESPLH
jgi:hypothetical protein